MEWSKMSNTEIRTKMASMKNEYDAIKMKINNLITKLDTLDVEYVKAQKELNERAKK